MSAKGFIVIKKTYIAEALVRGSQFRVESMMLRLARAHNLCAPSPTARQRDAMRAAECMALTMEPASAFYNDPVVVLDFQVRRTELFEVHRFSLKSLYPSVIIAYNYCYSTCLGDMRNIEQFSS